MNAKWRNKLTLSRRALISVVGLVSLAALAGAIKLKKAVSPEQALSAFHQTILNRYPSVEHISALVVHDSLVPLGCLALEPALVGARPLRNVVLVGAYSSCQHAGRIRHHVLGVPAYSRKGELAAIICKHTLICLPRPSVLAQHVVL